MASTLLRRNASSIKTAWNTWDSSSLQMGSGCLKIKSKPSSTGPNLERLRISNPSLDSATSTESSSTGIQIKRRIHSCPNTYSMATNSHIILETDASDYTLAAILSIYTSDGEIHPVAFHSHSFNPA
ncbi:hypothetical protein L208DRAFT_1480547, partial [Tricholoma matsutake]